MMGLLPNSSTRDLPQALQQAWQAAQACWQHPFVSARGGPQWVLASQPLFFHSLWSQLSEHAIHIYWPDFERHGTQSALSPYLAIALACEMGYFYFAPGNAAFAADLQFQARHQLSSHSLNTADRVLQQFLQLIVLDKLHQKGMATTRFLQIRQQSPDTRLPPWIARLYEYLWRLPTGDLTGAYTRASSLSDLEETTACLAQLIFHRQRYGDPFDRHLLSQLRQFLNYAVHHLNTPVDTPVPLLMVLPQPLGMLIPPKSGAYARPEDKAEAKKREATADPVNPRGVVRGCLSPQQLLSLLPGHQSLALLSRYYRQAAWPYLYPLRPPKPLAENVLEGIETWTLDHPIQQLNWQASLTTSPTLIPGITTRQQVQTIYPSQDTTPHERPQLTLYLDTSQSMPDPQQEQSLVVLTGFVLMLSALQMQWPVRIINWSEGESDTGLTHDEQKLTQALLQAPRGSTHFPLETLLAEARSSEPPQIIRVLLSDLGTVKSLQQLAEITPSILAELNSITLQCLLYLPLPAPYQQRSLQQLQALLPRWHFQALSHPSTQAQLWSHSHA
jgi:hypothetical protein